MLPRIKHLLLLQKTWIWFEHSRSGSQPSVTLVAGALMPSSDLFGHQACVWYTNIHADQTFIHPTSPTPPHSLASGHIQTCSIKKKNLFKKGKQQQLLLLH